MAALVLLVMVGIASLPSVSASLNWAEWRLIQSKIGILALFLAVAHVVAMGAPGWAKGGWMKTFRSITFLSGFLPAVTVLLRVVLALPPISGHLKKIRHGWERDSVCSEEVRPDQGENRYPLRKSNLKNSCCGSNVGVVGSRLASQNAVYTAIDLEEDGGCGSCQTGDAASSLPTRSCNCSSVVWPTSLGLPCDMT